MKQRMVTKFYSVTVNATGAAITNPKNSRSERRFRRFHHSLLTDHDSLFACILLAGATLRANFRQRIQRSDAVAAAASHAIATRRPGVGCKSLATLIDASPVRQSDGLVPRRARTFGVSPKRTLSFGPA